jgi:PAS domain S-box-containing protein
MDGDPSTQRPKPVEASERSQAELDWPRRAAARGGPSEAKNLGELPRLLHELRVHQLELEMQNSELRTAQHRLEVSRAQYRDLFDLAPAGYVNLDGRGVVQRANRAMGALLGVEPARLVGRSLAEFTDAPGSRALAMHLKDAASGCRTTELCLHRSDASYTYTRVESRPAPDGGCWTVLTDITDQKRAEHALQHANRELEGRVCARTEELGARNRDLEAALAARAASDEKRHELEVRLRDAQRLESLGLLAGGIAHDFNNLLAGVLAHADLLLLDGRLSEDVSGGLRTIRRAAQSAAALTRQLLVYAGRGHLDPKVVPLGDLLFESLRLLQARIPQNVSVSCELAPEGPCTIVADPVQVEQVVTNLVTNAVEAIAERPGRIGVSVRARQLDDVGLSHFPHRRDARSGPFVVLRVEDDGPGIAAATLSRVFDPFFTTKFTGRGLGLASVLGIVHGHGAALSVQSEPGRGTCFEIAWPAGGRAAVPVPRAPQVEARWHGRVLLVDDDVGVRNALAAQLEHLGFDVEQAEDAAGALEIARARVAPFLFAVVDRTMPGVSGDRLIAALHERDPGLRVLLVSGYSTAGPVEADPRVGFLAKPMTLSDVAQAIDQLLEHSQNQN